MDEWADARRRTDIIAQIGPSAYRPRSMRWYDFLAPLEFARLQQQAELLVAHCGTGSMISALETGQPVLMMPRRHGLGEHRNDHQWATAHRLRDIPGVHVALDEAELVARLDDLTRLGPTSPISTKAPAESIQALAQVLRELACDAESG